MLVYINVITLYIGDHVHVFQLAQDKAQNFLSANLHSPLHHPVLPTHWGPAVAQELPRCSGTGRRLSNAWLQRYAFQHPRELTVTKKQKSKKLKKDCTSYGGVYSGKKCLVCALDQKSNFNNFQQWVDFFWWMDLLFLSSSSSFFSKKKKEKEGKSTKKHLRFCGTKCFYNSFSLTSENSSLIVTTDNCDIFCWMMHKIIHNNNGRLQFTSQWLEPPQGATTTASPVSHDLRAQNVNTHQRQTEPASSILDVI